MVIILDINQPQNSDNSSDEEFQAASTTLTALTISWPAYRFSLPACDTPPNSKVSSPGCTTPSSGHSLPVSEGSLPDHNSPLPACSSPISEDPSPAHDNTLPACPWLASERFPLAHDTSSSTHVKNNDGNCIASESDKDDASSAFTEISDDSPIYNLIVRHGRGYFSYYAARYLLPHDWLEEERQQALGLLWMKTLRRDHLAPLPASIQDIFEIGSGSGSWAIAIAQKFPHAHITSADLCPPYFESVPKNLDFISDNLELSWIDIERYDYIFGRDLTLCFQNPSFVIRNAIRALKPGGYIEFQNIALPSTSDYPDLEGTCFEKWINLIKEGARSLGSHYWGVVSPYKITMQEQGLINIQEKNYSWKINKQLGGSSGILCYDNLYAISAEVLIGGMEMTEIAVKILLWHVVDEIEHDEFKASIPITVLYGQKKAL